LGLYLEDDGKMEVILNRIDEKEPNTFRYDGSKFEKLIEVKLWGGISEDNNMVAMGDYLHTVQCMIDILEGEYKCKAPFKIYSDRITRKYSKIDNHLNSEFISEYDKILELPEIEGWYIDEILDKEAQEVVRYKMYLTDGRVRIITGTLTVI
jgi:hypothetical protein